jgi:hypothetical protein
VLYPTNKLQNPAQGLKGFYERHGAFWDQDAGCSGVFIRQRSLADKKSKAV